MSLFSALPRADITFEIAPIRIPTGHILRDPDPIFFSSMWFSERVARYQQSNKDPLQYFKASALGNHLDSFGILNSFV